MSRGMLWVFAGVFPGLALADWKLPQVDRIVHLRYDMRDGSFRRVHGDPGGRGHSGNVVFDSTYQFYAAWFPEDTFYGPGSMVMDWGDVADTGPGRTEVGRIRFGYATNATDRPMLDLSFWGGEDGYDSGATRFLIARFRFHELPVASDFNVPNLPGGAPIGVIIDVNLPPDAPLVLVGPDLGEPNVGPPLPDPDCDPLKDPNCPLCEAVYSHCGGRGLRDFGYSFDFRRPGGGPPPAGEWTGVLVAMPDPNLVFAGLCPAPGAQNRFDVYTACGSADPCPPPGPNDPLVPDVNARHVATLEDQALCGQLMLRLTAPGGATCPGDLDGDGHRDLVDLSILLTHFGGPGGPSQGDLDGNGVVDLLDLSLLLEVFGTRCP